MKRSFLIRQSHGKQVGEARCRPAAVAKRGAAAEKQQAAAAAIHKLLDQFLLRRREVARFHRADDDRLVGEQILGARRETVGQFLRIVDPLAINFIFAGAQHGDDGARMPVILLRAADEFVFPARLALHVQDAALGGFDVHQPRDGIVGAIFLARQRVDGKLQRLRSGGAGIEQQRFVLRCAVGGQA